VDVLLHHAGDEDSHSYREALHRHAAELRSR
jgi:hypothetical protein